MLQDSFEWNGTELLASLVYISLSTNTYFVGSINFKGDKWTDDIIIIVDSGFDAGIITDSST